VAENQKQSMNSLPSLAAVAGQPLPSAPVAVYDKSYNKWFMAKENTKHWMSLSQQERKKYKVAIRMVEDVDTESLSENDCEVSFHDVRFKQGDICKIVHGNEICDVLPFMHK